MTCAPKTPDEWLEAIHQAFEKESDRAAGIVVAAMLDESLKLLLSKRMVQAPSKHGRITSTLDRDQPLSTFSARINAAFQLGLISRYMARDLHLVRDIRNDFSHEPFVSSFDSGPTKDKVKALDEASDYNKRNPELRRKIGPPGARWDFLGATAWMLYHLHRQVDETERFSEHGKEFGYIDWSELEAVLRKSLPDIEIN